MIFAHASFINTDFAVFLMLTIFTVAALIVGVAFHEFCHAAVATSLGDPLPRQQGRVTLNPIAHLDPFGTLMMLFIGFGWGKPVQWSGRNIRVSPKTAILLVSLAGPLSNFVAAGLLAIPIKLGWVPYLNPLASASAAEFRSALASPSDYVGMFLTGAVYFNIILGIFNLIPLQPLDGFSVALGILPRDLSREWAKLSQYGAGPFILVLFVIPYLTGYNPVVNIMWPVAVRLLRIFTGVG